MENRKHLFVDLFAGCGGLSLGLEYAGFFPILVNEIADEALQTYLTNRTGKDYRYFENCKVDDPEHPWIWKDVKALRSYLERQPLQFQEKVQKVHEIDIDKGELDLVVGGPPCQGFSGIGYRRSYSVDKHNIPSNHMYQHMIAIINQLRPRMFLFENVKGLLSARWYRSDPNSTKGDIWYDIRKDFKELLGDNYIIGWHLVYAYEYGVPQRRPRVLLVGIRRNLDYRLKVETLDKENLLINNNTFRAGGLLPQPSGTPPSLEDLLGDLIDDDFTNGGETLEYPKKAISDMAIKMRTDHYTLKVREKGDPVTEQIYSHHRKEIIEKFKYMITSGGIIREEHKTKKFAQRLLPKQWSNGKPTVTACSLPDDYVHFEQPRILTVREWARLQMFPDWYQFCGKRTTGGIRRAGNPRTNDFEREVPKYTQIGNAVPVGLAEAVGRHFKMLLNECGENK